MSQIELKAGLSTIPAILIAMAPQVFCPACWPAYAGILSSLGIGFVNYTPYLLPATITLLLVALTAFAYGANKRRGYGPLIAGFVSSVLIVVGKFYLEMDMVLYSGAIVLMSASIWNAWPLEKSI